MILIIGSTNDDILYFRTKMDIASVDRIAGKTEVFLGSYAGKDVAVTTSGLSNSLSAMITGLCLERYHPYFVLNVGSIHALDENLKQGDLYMADRVYFGGTDFTPWGSSIKYGQIPSMPQFFVSEDDYLLMIESIAKKMTNKAVARGFVMSTNKFYTNREKAESLINHHFAYVDGIDAFDTELGGISSTCRAFDIPWIALKSISYVIGHQDELMNFIRKGLESEPLIGSIISTLFLELSEHE
jgi:adenosylhomocysteine nucleosidase